MRHEREQIRIGRAAVGQGVFARARFERHQIIGEIRGQVLDDPAYGSEYCMDLRDGRTLEPSRPYRYLNHRCDPNCEIFFWDTSSSDAPLADRLWLQAVRPIKPGEELTIDYAWSADDAIPCKCGSPRCRGWVVSREELPVLWTRLNPPAGDKPVPDAGQPVV